MNVSDFRFDLPEELIALYPPPHRTDSRLLQLDRYHGNIVHRRFTDFPALLQPGDLLIFNDTRVIPARLFGKKETGGKVEVLLERLLDSNAVLAQVRASKSPAVDSGIVFDLDNGERVTALVTGREDNFFRLRFPANLDLTALIERIGHMPLPPYIKRHDELTDTTRYQTVYAAHRGAVAAPTAGLHFDQAMLAQIADAGIETAYVTLHVGAGTFQPIRVDTVERHQMHAEYLQVSAATCAQVKDCKARGGRVVAVGTTTVRSLETASASGEIAPYQGETRIFIYPGYRFKTVDALLTNFHLSESTLLMLVSAFSSREHILDAYKAAIAERYRFFSYGDAMFIA